MISGEPIFRPPGELLPTDFEIEELQNLIDKEIEYENPSLNGYVLAMIRLDGTFTEIERQLKSIGKRPVVPATSRQHLKRLIVITADHCSFTESAHFVGSVQVRCAEEVRQWQDMKAAGGDLPPLWQLASDQVGRLQNRLETQE